MVFPPISAHVGWEGELLEGWRLMEQNSKQKIRHITL